MFGVILCLGAVVNVASRIALTMCCDGFPISVVVCNFSRWGNLICKYWWTKMICKNKNNSSSNRALVNRPFANGYERWERFRKAVDEYHVN